LAEIKPSPFSSNKVKISSNSFGETGAFALSNNLVNSSKSIKPD
jgi:hypothetical protein